MNVMQGSGRRGRLLPCCRRIDAVSSVAKRRRWHLLDTALHRFACARPYRWCVAETKRTGENLPDNLKKLRTSMVFAAAVRPRAFNL